jgi:hypothetical protein
MVARVRHHGGLMESAFRDQALDAVREFHAEHGRLPRWREWERATESRPCAKTIEPTILGDGLLDSDR